MKKLVLLFFLAVSLAGYGQNLKNAEVYFYGIDFSHAKVYGAEESPSQFLEAFYGINRLFLSEPKKYDVGKRLRVQLKGVDLDPVEQVNKDTETTGLILNGFGGYQLTDEQIADAVKQLPLKETSGIGLVFIAEILNKSSQRAKYYATFFDIETRNIIDVWEGKGKAQGFGLRNYWARSVYNMMKSF